VTWCLSEERALPAMCLPTELGEVAPGAVDASGVAGRWRPSSETAMGRTLSLTASTTWTTVNSSRAGSSACEGDRLARPGDDATEHLGLRDRRADFRGDRLNAASNHDKRLAAVNAVVSCEGRDQRASARWSAALVSSTTR
jgi:hypothetical protein